MKDERGSATIVMTVVVAAIAVAAVAVAAMGALYAARAQAQNAADGAALAAAVATYPPTSATGPVASARMVAAENGALLISCSCLRDSTLSARTVQVVTGVRADVPIFGVVTVRAVARAEFDPRRWLG